MHGSMFDGAGIAVAIIVAAIAVTSGIAGALLYAWLSG